MESHYLTKWWTWRLFPVFDSHKHAPGSSLDRRALHACEIRVWHISRSELAVTEGTGNFNYGVCKHWLFLSFAHFSIFLWICESSLCIKAMGLSSSGSHAGVCSGSALGSAAKGRWIEQGWAEGHTQLAPWGALGLGDPSQFCTVARGPSLYTP